jgi:hypothetical protein
MCQNTSVINHKSFKIAQSGQHTQDRLFFILQFFYIFIIVLLLNKIDDLLSFNKSYNEE